MKTQTLTSQILHVITFLGNLNIEKPKETVVEL